MFQSPPSSATEDEEPFCPVAFEGGRRTGDAYYYSCYLDSPHQKLELLDPRQSRARRSQ